MATALAIDPVESALSRAMPIWRKDPERYALEAYSVDPEGKEVRIDKAQGAILKAVATYDRVAVRSTHGSGKTTAAAILTQWWLSTRSPALVVTLAGTWGHLEDKLWPEIHSWFRNWCLKEAYEIQSMGIYSTVNAGAWRAVASSSDRPENIEGWHSPNLLVISDEAKAIPDDVRAAIRGAMTGGVIKEAVLSTPPLVDAGWYCDLFGKTEGWHTIHIMAPLSDGVRAQLTPNMRTMLKGALESGRVSEAYADDLARDYGVESPYFQARRSGLSPKLPRKRSCTSSGSRRLNAS